MTRRLVGRDHGQFVIGQIDDLVGVAGQRRGVAGHEMLVGPHADDQGAAQPGGDQHLRPLSKEDRQSVGPLELREGRLDRADQRLIVGGRHVGQLPTWPQNRAPWLPPEATVDQVGDDFGVGGRLKLVSLLLEALLDGVKVLDDSVVNHGQRGVAAQVRVCVYIAWGTVGSPTGVSDPDVAGSRVYGQQALEPVDPAGRLDHGQFAAGGDGCHARTIVAPVFEAVESRDQEFRRITRSNVSNDPAHDKGSGVREFGGPGSAIRSRLPQL